MFLVAGCENEPPVTTEDGGTEDEQTGVDTTEPPPDEKIVKSGFVVEGNVFNADTGTPVRNVIVRVLSFPKFAAPPTNNLGDFRLELTDEEVKEIGENFNVFVDPNVESDKASPMGNVDAEGNPLWLPTIHGEIFYIKEGSRSRENGASQVVHICPTGRAGGTPHVWGGPSGFDVGGEEGVLARASFAAIFVDVTKVADGFQFPDMVPGTVITVKDGEDTDYAGIGAYLTELPEFFAAAMGEKGASSLDFDAKEANAFAGFMSIASLDEVPDEAVYETNLTVEHPDYATTERAIRTGKGYQTVALFLMVPKN